MFGEGPARLVVVVVVTFDFITFATQRQYQGLVVILGTNMSSKFTLIPTGSNLTHQWESFFCCVSPISLP